MGKATVEKLRISLHVFLQEVASNIVEFFKGTTLKNWIEGDQRGTNNMIKKINSYDIIGLLERFGDITLLELKERIKEGRDYKCMQCGGFGFIYTLYEECPVCKGLGFTKEAFKAEYSTINTPKIT